jgi:hypothetical protein
MARHQPVCVDNREKIARPKKIKPRHPTKFAILQLKKKIKETIQTHKNREPLVHFSRQFFSFLNFAIELFEAKKNPSSQILDVRLN